MKTLIPGCLAVAVLVCGCGPSGPDVARVEGTVTMDGKPLPHATVVFTPEGGRPAGARTDENGFYVLSFTEGRKGSMPGKNTVRIYTVSDPYEELDGTIVPASPETIPVQYNTETTLSFDVVADQVNVADFDLESGGRVATGGDEEQ